ncbi:peptide chain release factor 2 [Aerococcus sp. 1KP-2016]|nr:peptide chain release factor 2 [Aerococcus sp. 1KP-2016]
MNLKSIASGGLFDLDKLEADLAALESEMVQPGFWDNSEKAQAVIDQNNNLKKIYDNFNDLAAEWENLSILNDMVKEEPDAELQAELEEGITAYQSKISAYERNILLSGEYDHNDALLEIHPGAGGTESQDWASMLLRMYQRWAEQHDYQVTTLEYQNGDEAGIKSVTLEIKGLNAYGFLRSEDGIHRLVRISPFDSNNRRHTSFASVEIMPVLDQNTEIDIDESDIQMDVFRASGAGGQHINKTSSAVRLTHVPTGIVVASQSQRSQFQNRDTAMKMLQAKLAHLLAEKNAKELDEIRGEKAEIAWGSQIRSYVFHPYNMVKDHRTGHETANVQGVMDGDLDGFIDAYLKGQLSEDDTTV